MQAKPQWLRRGLSYTKDFFITREILSSSGLNTVCEEALCPNKAECWSEKSATFIILGRSCTRKCLFCNVSNNGPRPVNEQEPLRIAHTVKSLGLDYVTITSVTRDDLPDGGAGHFVKTVNAIKDVSPSCIIEVLIPDLIGFTCNADVIGHNIETVQRLYPLIRPQADYKRSLCVLGSLRGLIKSAIMLGLGENMDEVIETLEDLKDAGVSIVHIGQYLRPSVRHFPVVKYYAPSEFCRIKEIAEGLGFKAVSSGPFTRSSYHAKESYTRANTHVRYRVGHGVSDPVSDMGRGRL